MEQQRKEDKISIQQWFRDNVSTMAILVLCIAYLIYGLVTIKESGKSVIEIIAGSVISFFMGFSIKTLFNIQGVTNGEKSDKFVGTKLNYVDILEEIEPYQEYLGKYCEMKNEADLKTAQKAILKPAKIDYDKFINNEIDYNKLSKKQKKAYNKVLNLKIHFINDSILLSDFELSYDSGKDLSINKKKYLRNSNSKTFLMMILTAFLFGYFSIDMASGFNYKGMIWSAIQVAYYLACGAIQYATGYAFMTDTYRATLCEKTNLLKKFRNMYKAEPNKFTELKVEEHKVLVNDGFKKMKSNLKKEPTIVVENNLTTNQVEDKKPTQPILEPLKEEIKAEEPIKSFEELIKENEKPKEEKVQSFEEFKKQMIERNQTK